MSGKVQETNKLVPLKIGQIKSIWFYESIIENITSLLMVRLLKNLFSVLNTKTHLSVLLKSYNTRKLMIERINILT